MWTSEHTFWFAVGFIAFILLYRARRNWRYKREEKKYDEYEVKEKYRFVRTPYPKQRG